MKTGLIYKAKREINKILKMRESDVKTFPIPNSIEMDSPSLSPYPFPYPYPFPFDRGCRWRRGFSPAPLPILPLRAMVPPCNECLQQADAGPKILV
uniref:Uncharacterized protein n=1 Tax=Candidatus Kentrum sp. MB TaxID=2138164 RepID=A0A450WYD0_9GAMM|nr:MAG: hypothetical protein BECKMB1821G_GA0114241_100116 [Candidatus Kentron sp. MB]VFK27629.1 MAG: hypothetical protein BECKMB1821I_GA0114274_100416 [Candidatus Kentron sp. MB]VFK74368.1 MAG: hypothetical protein BECKMB1821H_GA0114242_100416 [Candidatus Kentron sp. MB]